MTTFRSFLAGIAAAIAFAGSAAVAQPYPTKPITLFVPFAAGGATDSIARILQDAMSTNLGQQIVIENIGGAGGMIAAARAARAAPDGYTIMIHQVALAAGVSLYKNLSFDAVKDFAPIGLINMAASVWTGRPDLPANNLDEMVKWAQEPGRNVRIAHPGVGAFGHLAGVLLTQEFNLTVTQVPYRGAGPAVTDLIGSQTDMASLSAVQATPLIQAGKIKGFAIIGRDRFPGLPDLPTFLERGHKKLSLDFWHVLLAPAGTPRPIIDTLNAAMRKAFDDPRVIRAFKDGGMDRFPPAEETPEAAAALLKREIAMWGDVIRSNNIQAQQ